MKFTKYCGVREKSDLWHYTPFSTAHMQRKCFNFLMQVAIELLNSLSRMIFQSTCLFKLWMMVCWTCRSSEDNWRSSIADAKPCFTGTHRYGFSSTSVHTESVKCNYIGNILALEKLTNCDYIIYQSVHQFEPYVTCIQMHKILQITGEI